MIIDGNKLIRQLNISAATLIRWRRLGMPCTVSNTCFADKGKRYRYDLEAVLAWLEAKAGRKPQVPQETRREAVQRLLAYLDTIPAAERGMLEEQIPNLAKMREAQGGSMEKPAQQKGVEA